MTEQKPPERIFNWLNSQLSIARFSGGLRYQGHSYLIAVKEDGQPLVRRDVLEREQKEQRHQARVAASKDKAEAASKQEQLI